MTSYWHAALISMQSDAVTSQAELHLAFPCVARCVAVAAAAVLAILLL